MCAEHSKTRKMQKKKKKLRVVSLLKKLARHRLWRDRIIINKKEEYLGENIKLLLYSREKVDLLVFRESKKTS